MIQRSVFFLWCLCIITAHAQVGQEEQEHQVGQADLEIKLLDDVVVQYEANIGMDSMYNFNFSSAKDRFYFLAKKYPWHALPYFLLGLNEWWKIMPNSENRAYDAAFLHYMDSAIVLGKNMYKYNRSNMEGTFILSGTHAFLGRFHSDRSEWFAAVRHAKKSLRYMNELIEKNYLQIEMLLGEGLYNFYSIWLRENHPSLRIFLMLFKKGDKDLGLRQLDSVAHNAVYTRVEAQYFLMKILSEERIDPENALRIARYLYSTYPNNTYFHRYLARLLYQTSRFGEALTICVNILQKVEQKQVGYDAASGRYAAFFMGWIYKEIYKEYDKASTYLKQALQYAKEANAMEMGYTQYTLIAMGELEEQNNNYTQAKKHYTQAKKLAHRRSSAKKSAKEHIQALRKKSKP